MRDMSIKVTKDDRGGEGVRITWSKAIAGGVVAGVLALVSSYFTSTIASERGAAAFNEWRKPVEAHIDETRVFKEKVTERISKLETYGSPASHQRAQALEARLASQEQNMVRVAADLNAASQLLAVSTESLRGLVHRLEQVERRTINQTNN